MSPENVAQERSTEPLLLEHVPGCGCRVEPDGKRVADMRCLTPDERRLVLALIDTRRNAEARRAE